MSARGQKWRIDVELAVADDDYYAVVHARLKGAVREAFERAVDAAWREKQAQRS